MEENQHVLSFLQYRRYPGINRLITAQSITCTDHSKQASQLILTFLDKHQLQTSQYE